MGNIKDIIRKVIRENFIKEMGINDTHLKAIMKYYDKGTPSTKKQVAIVVSLNKNANRGQILDDLMDMDYREILDTEKKLKYVKEYVDKKGVEHVAAALPQTEEEPVNEALVKGKTYGGSKCEGGCFMGKEGLKKIIKISKESPNNVFMFRDDNYSGLQPHFIKNGIIAKANTIGNPSYDLDRHKVRNLNIGKDVILSIRLFESVNECKTCNSK
jgi:hypothetical protein